LSVFEHLYNQSFPFPQLPNFMKELVHANYPRRQLYEVY
jgi:hypothetical protein